MLCMRYFGTDGIRDRADALVSNNIPYLLGKALGVTCGKVIVARDVRASSPTVERGLVAGLLDGDAEIYLAGVLPTPALAYIAGAYDARFAVMITASHNPPEFNGLKVFSRRGGKLSLREEEALDCALAALAKNMPIREDALEALAADVCENLKPLPPHRVRILHNAEEEYLAHVTAMFPRFDGENVTLDPAYGCMSGIARRAFEALGAKVSTINDERDGAKVNVGCGSTHIGALLSATPDGSIGFAFDGDGDRVIAAVEGREYDGDAILLALSTLYRIKGKLRKKIVVGTELTNSRLQRELSSQNIALMRTPVGDKYVRDALLENDCPLGGEKSGHILMLDRATTGDGLVTALSLLETKRTLGALPAFFPYPMLQFDLPSERPAEELKSDAMQKKLALAKALYGEKGRFILRASGTEPKLRVAYECFSPDYQIIFKEIENIFKE